MTLSSLPRTLWTTLLSAVLALVLTACSSLSAGDADVYGNWHLISVSGSEGDFMVTAADPDFTLRLNQDETAGGRVACNQWRGQVEITSTHLRVDNASSTRARCSFEREELQALEPRFLGQLQQDVRYRLDGDWLILTTSTDEEWRFQRR